MYIFIKMTKQTGKKKTCETSARRTHKLISLLNTKVDLLQDSINMVNDNVSSVIDTLDNKAGSAYLTPLLTPDNSSSSDSPIISTMPTESVAQSDETLGENMSSPSETSTADSVTTTDSGMHVDSGMTSDSDMTGDSNISPDSGVTTDSVMTADSESETGATVGSEAQPSLYESPMEVMNESESETKGGRRRRQTTNKRQKRRQRNSKRRNRRM